MFYWIDHVWSFKEGVCCVCDANEHLDAPSIGSVCVFVCQKLSSHLGCITSVCSPYVVSLCDFAHYVFG